MPTRARLRRSPRAFAHALGSCGALLAFGSCTSPPPHVAAAPAPSPPAPIVVSAPARELPAREEPRGVETLLEVHARLLEEQDTNCDGLITVEDAGSGRYAFELDGQTYELSGAHALSRLRAELSRALASGSRPRLERALEDPIAQASWRIEAEVWPALVRRLDEDGLPQVLGDEPSQPENGQRLYVSPLDPEALQYWRAVARRYDSAYRKLGVAVAGAPLATLVLGSSREEQARIVSEMLAHAEGRGLLRELAVRLQQAARTLSYPALARELESSARRLELSTVEAARPCLRAHPARLADSVARALGELGRFGPRELSVRSLPDPERWPQWSASLGTAHGLLALALETDEAATMRGIPFIARDGSGSAMSGWQSHFVLLGLLESQRLDLARALLDNLAYSIAHYGGTLENNRTHHLARPQPPFLATVIRETWQHTPETQRSRAWLRRMLSAAGREYDAWSQPSRQARKLCRGEGEARVCLALYASEGKGPPSEVAQARFDWLWQSLGRSLEASYAAGDLASRDLTAELDRAFRHERCARDSGHPGSHRWFWLAPDGHSPPPGPEPMPAASSNQCADIAGVDLNSLLYRYEVDLAHLTGALGSAPSRARIWCERARNRWDLMKEHLWSKRDGLFYDVYVSGRAPQQTGYVSAATLYPLWATAAACDAPGTAQPAETLTAAEKAALVTGALSQLEAPGGLLAAAQASRQRFPAGSSHWDYPHGFAAHQMLAWSGLAAHGFQQDAERLVSAWLYTVLRNAMSYDGVISEAYDLVRREAVDLASDRPGPGGSGFDRFGTDRASFSASHASIQVGLARLDPEARHRLGQALAER